MVGVALALPLLVGVGGAAAQGSPVRPPDAIDRARAQPLPRLPEPKAPPERWVPERRIYSPPLGRVIVVPGHWERRLSDTGARVPTLHGVIPEEGRTVVIPGGDRPPADIRSAP